MKKFILFAVMSLSYVWAVAQDIIITSDSKKIEAIILEVSDTEVKYKNANNPEGPTFILSVDKISSVIYSNGTVSVFSKTSTKPNNSGYNIGGQYIDKFGDSYRMGNIRMTEDQYFDFIQQNCAEAWESYRKGCAVWKAGWGLFGGGVGLFTIGFPLYMIGLNSDDKMATSGAVLFGVGAYSLAGSIPCLIVGSVKRNKSHEVYNEECASQTANVVEFGIQSSPDGIGLAMKW